MQTVLIFRRLSQFARQQVVYLLLASAIIAVFWAITGEMPELKTTLIYTFVLGNLTALALEGASIPCRSRLSSWSWFIYPAVLIVTTIIAVTIATAIVFVVIPPTSFPPKPRESFWAFLLASWKFPTVATLVFGGGYFAYISTRTRLERRNQQLQHTLESHLAERQLDAAELQQAQDIQRRLLPAEIPQLPDFQIAGIWEPARVVGGDYYDVIRLGNDKIAVCVADVVGKGVAAALLMANVQAAVRAFASESAAPSYVCSKANSVLCSNIASGKFVTLFYGVLDARARSLQFTNAGHLRPILIDSNGGAKHLENGGALLGVFPQWKYEDSEITLHLGDLLMLFTDGITEAASTDGEEFGEDRLIRSVTDSANRSPDHLQGQLLADVKKFCNSRMADDATLVLISYSSPEQTSVVPGYNESFASVNSPEHSNGRS